MGVTAALGLSLAVSASGCSGEGPGEEMASDSVEAVDLDTTEQLTFFGDHDSHDVLICGGFSNRECSGDDVCVPFLGIGCPGPGVLGICVPPPRFCFPISNPVCGCDGNDYPNICTAVKNGSAVDHRGECEEEEPEDPTCGGPTGQVCPGMGSCIDDMGEVCRPDEATCEGVCECKLVEKCEPREVWDMDPSVCGCIPAPPDACAGVECPERTQCVVHDDGTTACEEIGEK